MTTSRLKRTLALVLLLFAAAATVVVTGRLGRIIELAGTGADSGAAFTQITASLDQTAITWKADADLPRTMEAGTRAAVGEAYLISMALLDEPHAVSDDDLAVHLTGPALTAARVGGSAPALSRTHTLRIVFYSADGQLVEIEDEATRIAALDRETAVLHRERAVAVMVSIDGVWHLRHRVVDEITAAILAGHDTAPDPQAHEPRKESP